jgi:hypothetical protein
MYAFALQSTFDVAPADIPGIDYMTRSTISEYQVVNYCCQFNHLISSKAIIDTLFVE